MCWLMQQHEMDHLTKLIQPPKSSHSKRGVRKKNSKNGSWPNPLDFSNMRSNKFREDRLTQRAKPSDCHEQPHFRHLFIFMAREHALHLALALIATVAAACIKASSAILLGRIFGDVSSYGAGILSESDTLSQISRWCYILVILGAGSWVANFAFIFSWSTLSELYARSARRRLLQALLNNEMEWYDRQSHGISSLLVRTHT